MEIKNFNNNEPPDWFNLEYSNLLSLPDNNYVRDDVNIHFGCKEYNDLYNEHYKFNDPKHNFKFRTDLCMSNDDIIKKFSLKKEKLLKQTNDESTIKGIETKMNKKISHIDKTTIAFTFRIYPTESQKSKTKLWLKEALDIRNKCIEIHNNDPNYFYKGYMDAKVEIFSLMNINFACPYDSRTHSVSKFCDDLKSARSNYKVGNIKHFTMKPTINPKCQNLYIPKTSINETSIFPSYLGAMKGITRFFQTNNIKIDDIGDSYMRYDRVNDKYFMIIPYYKNKKVINKRKDFVALDPGESTGFAYYSQEGFGSLGINIRKKILKEHEKIRQLQSILSRGKNNKNDNNRTIKNKKKLKTRIDHHYDNIHNYVKEFHNKVALYLVRNYNTILIPEFGTQQMISNTEKIKWEININPKCNLSKEEIINLIKKKDLNEVNDILDIYVKANPKVEQKEIKKINENDISTITLLEKQKKDLKINKNISNNEKQKLLDMTDIYISILRTENMIKKEILKKEKEFEKIQKEREKYDKDLFISKKNEYIGNFNKLINSSLNNIEKTMIENLLKLGMKEEEISKYMKNTLKEKEKYERKQEIIENVEKLKISLNSDNKVADVNEILKLEHKKAGQEKFKKVLELIKEKYGEEIGKIYKRKLTKKSKLNKRVKFVLQMLSHYSFRQHLMNKSNEYGCVMLKVTEEFTSKTCTNCGYIENKFNKRIKKCSNCNYCINRDHGGSRNIAIKNLYKIIVGLLSQYC